MIMLAVVAALNVEALKTLSSSSAGSATTGFSAAASVLDEGSSAIFLQNSAVGKGMQHHTNVSQF